MYCSNYYSLLSKIDMHLSFSLRFISVSPRANKDSTIASASGKLTVLKKKIPANKNGLYPVEVKTASSVIRRLNWENKCLFGPIQYPKIVKNDEVQYSNQVIQHETRIPITEPSYEENTSLKSVINLNVGKSNSLNFKALLSFPLVNDECSPSDKFLSNEINEWNILRKDLEQLCVTNYSFPSVSSILEKTMPKERTEILNRWKRSMIKQLGEEGFQIYHKELLNNGASLHNIINSYLTTTPESELLIKEENKGHWKSLRHVFPNIRNVKLLEEFVIHPFLCYKGVIDCFAEYKNQLVVIDWKTSKKSKHNIKSTYDNPLQIAAYVGALNFDPKYQYMARNGLIVVAYENGSPASTHFINNSMLLDYWNQWLLRVKEFWEMKTSEND